jgi:DNA-binding MarR family transcriptional regulator
MTFAHTQSGRRVLWLPNDGPRPDRYEISEARRRRINTHGEERRQAKSGRKPGFETPLAVLAAIGRIGETSAEIATALGLCKSSVNNAAMALEARGLIVRTKVRCGKTYELAMARTAEGHALANCQDIAEAA